VTSRAGGGSGGESGFSNPLATGGAYGGGGGGDDNAAGEAGRGGHGAVRIIWGAGRAFPSTNTADATAVEGVVAASFTLTYTAAESGATDAGVAAVDCPSTIDGFTLTASGSGNNSPGGSAARTCTYAANETDTAAGTTSSASRTGTATDAVGNSTTFTSGYTLVQDVSVPVVTLVGIVEFSGTTSVSVTDVTNVNVDGSSVWAKSATAPGAGTSSFRLEYSITDPAGGAGIAAGAYSTATDYCPATQTGFTLTASSSAASNAAVVPIPAAEVGAGTATTLYCYYTGTTTSAATNAALAAVAGKTYDDRVGNTSSAAASYSYGTDSTAPAATAVSGYPRVERTTDGGTTWTSFAGTEPLDAGNASLYQASAGSSTILADGTIPATERIVAKYTISDPNGIESVSCPATITGFTLDSSTSPSVAATANGSGVVTSSELTCIYTGNGATASSATPANSSAGDAINNSGTLAPGWSLTVDTSAPTVTYGALSVSSPAGKLILEGTTILHVAASVPATESFTVTYTVSDTVAGVRSIDCPVAPAGFDKTTDASSATLPSTASITRARGS
jgi:hypothetical protein